MSTRMALIAPAAEATRKTRRATVDYQDVYRDWGIADQRSARVRRWRTCKSGDGLLQIGRAAHYKRYFH